MKYYAAICLIARDEDKDIKEWLSYHLAIGFEHVIIYDNNSRTPIKHSLRDFVEAGLVTVLDLPLTKAQQLSAYMHALENWRDKTAWLAFIDVDEFILPLASTDIRDFLDAYTQFGGIGAHWAMFSSNGHMRRPTGGILENYTQNLGLSRQIKSIVRPSVVKRTLSPHHFQYRQGYYCVNEDRIPILDFQSYPLANKIRINHYYYKSQQDFQDKIARGMVTQMVSGAERTIEVFYKHIAKQGVLDDSILKFLPLVRKLEKFPARALAGMVLQNAKTDLLDGLNDLTASMEAGRIEDAQKKYEVLARYHDDVTLRLIGANLAFLQDRAGDGLQIISRQMTREDVSAENLRDCYRLLANYYGLCGNMPEKENLLAFADAISPA